AHRRVDRVAGAFQLLVRIGVAVGRFQREFRGLLRQHLDLRGQRDRLAILAVLHVELPEIQCREADRDQQQDNECGIPTLLADAPCSAHVHLVRLLHRIGPASLGGNGSWTCHLGVSGPWRRRTCCMRPPRDQAAAWRKSGARTSRPMLNIAICCSPSPTRCSAKRASRGSSSCPAARRCSASTVRWPNTSSTSSATLPPPWRTTSRRARSVCGVRSSNRKRPKSTTGIRLPRTFATPSSHGRVPGTAVSGGIASSSLISPISLTSMRGPTR